jgi:hypothetical protein
VRYGVTRKYPLLTSAAAVLCAVVAPRDAVSFAIETDHGGSPATELSAAARWDAEPYHGTGLADGLQVAIAPDVAADLGVAPEDVPTLDGAIDDAFRMWENDALHFEIAHASPLAARGTDVGAEIDVFTVPGDDPEFLGNPYFGVTEWRWEFVQDRLLPNGQRSAGYVITGADIFLNATRLVQTQEDFGIPIGLSSLALTRLLAHEIGHALGFAHPNEGRNFDRDLDPLDLETVDPRDPFAGIGVSPNFDTGAILSNQPCGPVLTLCAALFFQTLQPDDQLGRDVLYAPEPAPTASLACIGATWALLRRRRKRPRA